jgi:hypothetical protein
MSCPPDAETASLVADRDAVIAAGASFDSAKALSVLKQTLRTMAVTVMLSVLITDPSPGRDRAHLHTMGGIEGGAATSRDYPS